MAKRADAELIFGLWCFCGRELKTRAEMCSTCFASGCLHHHDTKAGDEICIVDQKFLEDERRHNSEPRRMTTRDYLNALAGAEMLGPIERAEAEAVRNYGPNWVRESVVVGA